MSRLEFSNKTKRAAYERSGGLCECHLIPWIMLIRFPHTNAETY